MHSYRLASRSQAADMNGANGVRWVVWLGLFFVTGHAQTDIMFSRTEYAVDEERGPLRISLSAELKELAPTENVVVTIALTSSKDDTSSATPYRMGGSEGFDFILTGEELTTFSSDPFNVTFFPGTELSTVHNVTIVQDNLYEGFESFHLNITQIYAESSLQDQLRIGSSSPVRVTIVDNDILRVQFSQIKLDVEEGQVAVLQGEIHNESNPFQRPLTVGVICFEPQTSSFQGITPATEDVDFVARERYTLTFTDVGTSPRSGAGVKSSSHAEVQTNDDAIAEGTESFVCALRLTVSPNDPLKSADPDTITISIIDNDMLTIRWEKPVYFFVENVDALVTLVASNQFTVNFTLPGMATETNFLLVNGVMYGKAESGVDFEEASSVAFGFSSTTGRLSINSFIIHNDDVLEDDEVFLGTFIIPPLVSATKENPSLTSIVIRDDDAVIVRFNSAHFRVSELNSSLQIFLEVEGKFVIPLAATVQCRAMIPESARDGSDFVGMTRVVEFLPKQSQPALSVSGPITVNILDDGVLEDDETFICEITNVSHPRMNVGSQGEALITLLDDDEVTVQYSAPFYSAVEEDKQVTLSVLLLGETAIPVIVMVSSIPLQANSSRIAATFDKDFVGFTHELTFDPSGEKTLIFSVILHDDQVSEPPEYFNVNVSTEQPRVNIGQPSLPLVEIADNDSFVAVTLGSSNYIVLESTGHVEVCVTLNSTYPADIPIIIQSSNGQGDQAALSVEDYASADLAILVPRLSTVGCINVTVVDDTVVEMDEQFRVDVLYSAGQPGVLVGTPSEASITIINDDALQVSLEHNVLRVNESAADVVLRVVATGLASFGYEVEVNPFNGTATLGLDYGETGGRVIAFSSGSLFVEARYTIMDDDLFESTETFSVNLTVGSVWMNAGVQLGTPNRTTVEIQDDEVLAVFFQSAVYNVSEGSTVELVLVTDRMFTFPVSVELSTRNGSAVQGLDFVGQGIQVTLDVTSQSALVPVQALHDSLCEGAEQFTVALSQFLPTTMPRIVIGSPGVASVSIMDLTGVCVSFASAEVLVAEGEALEFTLALDKTCPHSLSVDVTLMDGTAVAPEDYVGGHYSVLFNLQSQTATLEIQTNTDNVLELLESFVATVTVPETERLTLCGSSNSSISIQDGTTAEVFFSPPKYSIKEGDTVTLMLQLSAEVAPGVSYEVTVILANGTAHSPVDFVGGQLVAEFSGSSMAKVEVHTLQELPGLVEGTENFTAGIANPLETSEGRIASGHPSIATVDIADSNELSVFFTQSMYFVNESDTMALVTIEASGVSQESYTVTITVNPGTATYLDDYNLFTFDMIFEPGTLEETFAVPILDDSVAELSENILLEIFVSKEALIQNVLPGDPIRSQVIILDDDERVAVKLTGNDSRESLKFIQMCVTKSKPSHHSLNVEVLPSQLSPDPMTAVGVIEDNIIAEVGNDFQSELLVVQLSPRELQKCVNITVHDDLLLEKDEKINISMIIPENQTGVLGGEFAIENMSPTVCIIDDDAISVMFEHPKYTTVEEETRPVEIKIVASGEASFPYIVNVSLVQPPPWGRNATAGKDFVYSNAELTIEAGQTELLLPVPIVDDEIFEATEFFQLLLSVQEEFVACNVSTGTPSITSVMIMDLDNITVYFEPSVYNVTEGQKVKVTLVTDRLVEQPIMITVETRGGSATGNLDYSTEFFLAQFMPRAESAYLCVSTTNDTIVELREEFHLLITGFSPPEVPVVIGDPDTATIVIYDSIGKVPVAFEQADYFVKEGADKTVNLTVVAGVDHSFGFTVQIRTADGTATDGEDYNGGTIAVEFPAGINRVTVLVSVKDDDIVELNETFTALLVIPTTASTVGVVTMTPDSAMVTIQNDDDLDVSFSKVDYTVREDAGPLEVVLTASRSASFEYSVTVIPTAGSANAGEDFAPEHLRAVFAPGQREATVLLGIVDNAEVEPDEDLILEMEVLGDFSEEIEQSIVTIWDNDVTVSFARDKYYFKEDDVRGIVVLKASGDTSQPFTVVVHSTDGTATEGVDYHGKEFVVKFEASITSMSFQVPIVSDKVQIPAEGDENFTLGISNVEPDTRVDIGTPNMTLVLILDSITNLGGSGAVNDTVVGDPLFTVPLFVPDLETFPEFGGNRISLCYEFAGSGGEFYNLVSDKCTSVNARYAVVQTNPTIHVMSEIGIKSEGNNFTCHEVHIILEGCQTLVDRQPLNGTYRREGVVVFARHRRVRVDVPNCVQGRHLVMWVSCARQQGVDMLHFRVNRQADLDPSSHGLMAQFWNIPTELTRYSSHYGGSVVNASAGIYEVKVMHPDSSPRTFLADLGDSTWDNQRSQCLYAGDSYGGSIWEAPQRYKSVIEGNPQDYEVMGLMENDFTFSKYISDC